MARNARRYAESSFDIDQIGNMFEVLLSGGNVDTHALSSRVPISTCS
jgi:hypothetical protein